MADFGWVLFSELGGLGNERKRERARQREKERKKNPW